MAVAAPAAARRPTRSEVNICVNLRRACHDPQKFCHEHFPEHFHLQFFDFTTNIICSNICCQNYHQLDSRELAETNLVFLLFRLLQATSGGE